MVKPTPPGLRERKHFKTRVSIHKAAVELVLERGLDVATIEAISEKADISPRTFFNYFASKEDALLGLSDPANDAALIQSSLEQSGGADLIDTVARFVSSVIAATTSDTLPEDRIEIIRRYPFLIHRLFGQMARLDELMTASVATLIDQDRRFDEFTADATTRTDSARLIVAVCFSAIRCAFSKWSATDLSQHPEQDSEDSIKLLKEILRRLA